MHGGDEINVIYDHTLTCYSDFSAEIPKSIISWDIGLWNFIYRKTDQHTEWWFDGPGNL